MDRARRSRGRPKSAPLVAMCLIIVAALAAVYLDGRAKPILESARVFCHVPRWAQYELGPTDEHYLWIDNEKALILPHEDYGITGGPYVESHPTGSSSRRPLPLSLPSWAAAVTVSPNGKYAAYFDRRSQFAPGNRYDLVVSQLDGRQIAHCEWTGDVRTGPCAWTQDSSGIVMVQNLPAPCLKRLSVVTGRVETAALPRDPALWRDGAPDFSSTGFASRCRVLGFTAPYTLVIAPRGVVSQNAMVPLVEISTTTPIQITRKFTFAIPAGAEMGTLELSPTGDRLFWGAMCYDRMPPWVWLQLIARLIPGEGAWVERGWVCRLDGSGMREIGYYTIPAASAGSSGPVDPPWIIDPKWTPDGKRISFVYADKLMTVPVD